MPLHVQVIVREVPRRPVVQGDLRVLEARDGLVETEGHRLDVAELVVVVDRLHLDAQPAVVDEGVPLVGAARGDDVVEVLVLVQVDLPVGAARERGVEPARVGDRPAVGGHVPDRGVVVLEGHDPHLDLLHAGTLVEARAARDHGARHVRGGERGLNGGLGLVAVEVDDQRVRGDLQGVEGERVAVGGCQVVGVQRVGGIRGLVGRDVARVVVDAQVDRAASTCRPRCRSRNWCSRNRSRGSCGSSRTCCPRCRRTRRRRRRGGSFRSGPAP